MTLSRVVNFLFCAGWTERSVSLAHSVRLTPAQSAALDRWLDLTMHFLATAEADYCQDALRGQLGNLRMVYAGQTSGRAQELVADQVTPAWPIAEHARCLKPVSEWPPHPPKVVVLASDGDGTSWRGNRAWAVRCYRRAIMQDLDGALILIGAMGVKKLKEHADGTVTQLQRFITNLVPMNSYLRAASWCFRAAPSRWSARVDPAGGRRDPRNRLGGHGLCLQLVSHAVPLARCLHIRQASPIQRVSRRRPQHHGVFGDYHGSNGVGRRR